MKKILLFIFFILTTSLIFGQPCKLVKRGMTKLEVLKLVGNPTEIDTIPDMESKELRVVWQYGDVMQEGNQRVQFTGNVVDSDVIADGKKFEELMILCQHEQCSDEEVIKMIKQLNDASCK